MATCGQGGICYVKNDGCREFTGTLNVTSIDFASGNVTVLKAQAVSLPAGPGAIEWFNLTASPFLLSASTGAPGKRGDRARRSRAGQATQGEPTVPVIQLLTSAIRPERTRCAKGRPSRRRAREMRS